MPRRRSFPFDAARERAGGDATRERAGRDAGRARVSGAATRNLLLLVALVAVALLLARLVGFGAADGDAPAPLEADVATRASHADELAGGGVAGADALDAGGAGRSEAVPVGVRLRGAGRLEGRVVERASGLGVVGARVDLLPVPPAGATLLARVLRIARGEAGIEERVRPLAVAETGADGAFAFEGVRAGTWYVDARGPYHVPETVRTARVLASGAGGPIDVFVVAGGRVVGTVLAPDGGPAPRARIALVDGPGSILTAARAGTSRWFESSTDERGAFAFDGVAPGGGYELSVSGDGFALSHATGIEVRAREDTTVVVRTRRGGTIAGRVVSAPGKQDADPSLAPAPLAGAHLAAVPRGLRDLRFAEEVLRATHATSGPDGSFAMRDVPPGDVDVVAVAFGHLPAIGARVAVAGDARADASEVVLVRGATVRGRAVDPEGAPVAGASLRWNPIEWEGTGFDFGFAPFLAPMVARALDAFDLPRTDADGRFVAGPIAGDPPWKVDLAKRGFADAEARFDPTNPEHAGPDGITVVMHRGGSIEGIVIDTARSEPVGAFTLATTERIDVEEGAPSAENPFAGGVLVEDAGGRFALRDLRAGNVDLVVSAPGYLDARLEVAVAEGAATKGVIVKLDPGAAIRGVVVDEQGRPVSGAQVVALDPEGDVGAPRASRRPESTAVRARRGGGFGDEIPPALRSYAVGLGLFGERVALSGARGEFELVGIAPGTVHLSAYHRDFAAGRSEPVELGAGARAENVVVRMELGGGIEGRVRDRFGRPVQGGIVVALAPAAFAGRGVAESGSLYQDETDAQGAYRIAPMIAGSYFVVVTRGDEALDPMSFFGTLNLDLVGVTAGGVVVHDLVDSSAGACRVHGRVTYRGDPVERGNLVAIGYESESLLGVEIKAARIGAGGRFEFAGLSPGEYQLDLDGDGGSTRMELEVPDRPELELDLRLPDATLEGVVVDDASGAPIAGVSVSLADREPREGNGLLGRMISRQNRAVREQTDDEGRFRFERLRTAAYRLACGGDDDHAPSEPRVVEVDEGRAERVEIRLLPALAIEGRVVDRAGAPIAKARVFARDADGTPRRATSADDGRYAIRGLAPRTYSLSASAGGYADAKPVDVALARGGDASKEVDVVLEPGIFVRVRIVDASGRPVSGARAELVRAGQTGPEAAAAGDRMMSRIFEGQGGSDADGRLEIGRHLPGAYRLLVQRGFTRVESAAEIGAEPDEVELRAELP